ncbi:MAG: glycosyltransferase family 4 protein [Cyanobacteriota bacterium]
MPSDIQIEIRTNLYFSKGILNRLLDAISAVKEQQDVNHVTGDVHYLTFFLKKKKTILTIHDCEFLERSKGIKFYLLWLFWFFLPDKRSSAIVVVSEETRKKVLAFLNCRQDKIRVIHNPLSAEFIPSPRPFNNLYPTILHIGTKQNKNLENHISSLEGINCRLLVIGHLSETHKVLLKEHQIDYQNLFDLSPELLLEQYHHCDILLFASTYEGFGLPIIEAQAVGRPVITSNLSSMPEIAGNSACLVDPFDVESIRTGIRRIITDSEYRESLVQKGFQNIERFRPENISAQYAELYREVFEISKNPSQD